jgi:hypothetical protein
MALGVYGHCFAALGHPLSSPALPARREAALLHGGARDRAGSESSILKVTAAESCESRAKDVGSVPRA